MPKATQVKPEIKIQKPKTCNNCSFLKNERDNQTCNNEKSLSFTKRIYHNQQACSYYST